MGLIPGCNKDLVLVVEGLGYKPEGGGLNMCACTAAKVAQTKPFCKGSVFFFAPNSTFFCKLQGVQGHTLQRWPNSGHLGNGSNGG